MFRLVREELISGDFGLNMRLLQNTSEVLPDIQVVIRRADELRQKDSTRRDSSGSMSSLAKQQIGKRLKNIRSSLNSKSKKLSDAVMTMKPSLKSSISVPSSPAPDLQPKESKSFMSRGRESFRSVRIKHPFRGDKPS